MAIRSFLAFELPPDIRSIISGTSEEMQRFPLDVRWIKVHNIHLTVIFIGNFDTKHMEPLGDTVADVCRLYMPFQVSLGRAGFFGDKRHPRVLWIRLDGDIERMSDFRDDLQTGLRTFGIKQEKRQFRPHLTLGRFRKGARGGKQLDELLSLHKDQPSPSFAFGELILFKSDLKPGGAVYTRMNAWGLGGCPNR